ncbi:glycosyltransferase family 4 protein [Aquirufa ecclesiirivi]|uniref:glycosyltransferase family 4 protein n=1 Tax=Aquirufa ecclesiirivi TaxID=2715124 RepID=UPI0022A81B24|nr:glycosyltransferase family 4 protein [Aquirufa ecclesiirivi]MCZ2471539.1 glycosyltransferase family 4 protein [Aquirufa ecclesiirivi]
MKLMSLAGGLPHYYNLVLNKLQHEFGVEVVVVVPSGNGATLGAGVFESKSGIEFNVIYAEEYTTYYGKKFFKGLKDLILQEKPDVLMVNWPYQLAYVFYPSWYRFLRQQNVALISKEIPFQVPSYPDAIDYYLRGGGITENNQQHQKNTSLLAYLKYWMVRESRKHFVNLVDAHINYLDEAKQIHASYGVSEEKVFVTANSPDTDFIAQQYATIEKEGLPEMHTYRLLHVGRLVKWKQVDLLIQATVQLKAQFPQTELHIVGDGPEMAALKQQAESLGANDYIHFWGGIYDMRELGKITLASGIYVLAGMGGLSINEAMCFAKPVVCSVADGTEKRLVKEGINGRYFESGSLKSLVEVIADLFQHPEKITAMGLASKKIIEQEINIHTVLTNYMEAFKFAINHQKKR